MMRNTIHGGAVSNIAAGTGTNFILEAGEVKTYRFRAYMKPLLAGE